MEQIAASETTENIAEILFVQEQVIVHEIPDVVDSPPPVEELTDLCTSESINNRSLQEILRRT